MSKNAAVNNDTRDSDSPFGVLDFLVWDHEWNSFHYAHDKAEKSVKLMKEAGVGFVRMDFLWQDIEAQKGALSFEKYDRIVQLLTANEIKILGLLNYNVTWASGRWNESPDPELFAHYAKSVVHRYKDRIKYWEVWNEPDDAIYWSPQDGLKSYSQLLKKLYPVLKREDPTCSVVVGGLSKEVVPSLKRLYENGAKSTFDVVNIHPFMTPKDPAAMGAVRAIVDEANRIMAQYGDETKPVWITEIGCPGLASKDKAAEWWLGTNTTEEEQKQWLEKIYDEMLQWKNVKKIFWAFFRDTPNHFESGTDFFGLVRQDFTKKPAYFAYQKRALEHQRQGSAFKR